MAACVRELHGDPRFPDALVRYCRDEAGSFSARTNTSSRFKTSRSPSRKKTLRNQSESSSLHWFSEKPVVLDFETAGIFRIQALRVLSRERVAAVLGEYKVERRNSFFPAFEVFLDQRPAARQPVRSQAVAVPAAFETEYQIGLEIVAEFDGVSAAGIRDQAALLRLRLFPVFVLLFGEEKREFLS